MLFSRRWLEDYVQLPPDSVAVAERLTFAGFTVEDIREVAAGEAAGDTVFDIDVTTNRPDCMNHFGLARELAVLYDQPLRPPESQRNVPALGSTAALIKVIADELPQDEREGKGEPSLAFDVVVDDPAGCPRFTATLIEGVRVGPSPPWLTQRLAAIGLRSINNIVDVTNFVLWELGQPMHAYDYDRLAGGRLVVRRGRPGERLTTLDGVERRLDAAMLVIADADRAVGLAGVMGGLDTEVTAGTTRILLESAFFDRTLVRHAAKALGMHTDASHRFERGIDLAGCLAAAARAAALIAELGGGQVVQGAADVQAPSSPARQGRLDLRRLNAFAGAEVASAEAERWLGGLGFGLSPVDVSAPGSPPVAWDVTVPSWRWFDFEPAPDGQVYEADLFEEVIRIFGFDRIPAALPAIAGSDGPRTERQLVRDQVRRVLAGAGFAEAVNFGFEDPPVAAGLPSLRPEAPPLRLANPLSENLSVMRRSLLGNLVESARFNQRRGATAVRLFEIGTVFFPRQPAGAAVPEAAAPLGDPVPALHPHDRTAELPDEVETVALVCGGRAGSPWERGETVDFFDLKGDLEALAAALGRRFTVRAAALNGLRDGNAAELLDDHGQVAGFFGRLDAEAGYALYVSELKLAALAGAERIRALGLPPRVPGIGADLTLTHALAVTWEQIAAAIEAVRPPDLTEFGLKVRYQGEGVPAGAVNTTISFLYNAGDRSLTQDEVNGRQAQLAAELAGRFGWKD